MVVILRVGYPQKSILFDGRLKHLASGFGLAVDLSILLDLLFTMNGIYSHGKAIVKFELYLRLILVEVNGFVCGNKPASS